jgi:DNA-binding response OmpR family regulator
MYTQNARGFLNYSLAIYFSINSPLAVMAISFPSITSSKVLELSYKGQTVYISQREADLLDLLLQHKNNLLDRRTALLKIWGDDNVFNARSMDVYITRLRKYFLKDAHVEIQNIRGQGFKLIEHV